MDCLTFTSNAIDSLAWPVALVIGLLVFKRPITTAVFSLKRLRYKDLEVELVAPQEAGEQDISEIVSYLQRSPHSFQWFRDNTEFQYTDPQFESLVATHPEILQRITIVSSDQAKRKSTAGLPGLRLTAKGRDMIKNALHTRTT